MIDVLIFVVIFFRLVKTMAHYASSHNKKLALEEGKIYYSKTLKCYVDIKGRYYYNGYGEKIYLKEEQTYRVKYYYESDGRKYFYDHKGRKHYSKKDKCTSKSSYDDDTTSSCYHDNTVSCDQDNYEHNDDYELIYTKKYVRDEDDKCDDIKVVIVKRVYKKKAKKCSDEPRDYKVVKKKCETTSSCDESTHCDDYWKKDDSYYDKYYKKKECWQEKKKECCQEKKKEKECCQEKKKECSSSDTDDTDDYYCPSDKCKKKGDVIYGVVDVVTEDFCYSDEFCSDEDKKCDGVHPYLKAQKEGKAKSNGEWYNRSFYVNGKQTNKFW